MMRNARSGAARFARLEAENSRLSARLGIAPRAPTDIPSRGLDLSRSGKQEARYPSKNPSAERGTHDPSHPRGAAVVPCVRL